ncbi:MAG: TRAP transporter small permease [Oscillospiraceae bacterium]|nr:TRAP transporter small permease [Oscillospiraceae bacterium]
MRKVLDKATSYFRVLSCILFLAVAVLTLINVVGRSFFNSPLQGATEIVQYGTMLAAAAVMSRTGFEHRHIIVNVIFRRFPKMMQKILSAIANILGTIVFGGVAYLYYRNVVKNFVGGRVTDALQIPYWVLYTVLCAGFALGAIVFLYQAYESVRDIFKKDDSFEAPPASIDEIQEMELKEDNAPADAAEKAAETAEQITDDLPEKPDGV